MKKINNSGISEIMSALMLILVAVSVSAAYYTWVSGLQEETQNTGSDVADVKLNSFMSEIEVVTYPEYDYYNIGNITVTTTDNRFIQEIQVIVKNKALFNLTNVKVKILSFDKNVDWAGIHISNDRELLNREGEIYYFNNESIYFTSENKSKNSIRLITDQGYSYFASNRLDGSTTINTTTLTNLFSLHNPTYKIGNISKGEYSKGYIYLLLNHTSLPIDADLKLYITDDQGVDAYQTIKFDIQ